MNKNDFYLMENPEEILRLETKTDLQKVHKQALWCGIRPGLKILDAGCGSGKAASVLFDLSQPGGEVLGVDFSQERVEYARQHYADKKGLNFYKYNLRKPLRGLNNFDLIWARFFLEYHREESFQIVKNLNEILKPGGTLCLIDLDHNGLNHYELSQPLAEILNRLCQALEEKFNFDPYVGRKLYSYLFDLGYTDIQVELEAHHLIYGDIEDKDIYNWTKKIETVFQRVPEIYEDYPGGVETFYNDLDTFLKNPRRFTYTPLMMCKGTKR